MNADELDAAREAVSATRTWRDQMRADWGTSFREPEEVLDEAVGELTAERDRLRAVVDAARMAVAGVEFANPGGITEPIPINRLADLKAALDQLDVSPTMGGTDSVGGRRLTVAVEPTDHRGAGDATPGTPSETSAMGRSEDDPTDVVTAAITSHYVSTYCIHADHERCRLVCKTCDAPCRCHCHGKDTDAETVGPSARVGETGLAGTGNDAGAGVAEVAGLPDLDPSVGDRATCRWCHRPIIFTSASVLSVIEDAWVHEGPQPGSGHARQLACEPDMQSMLAEPEES